MLPQCNLHGDPNGIGGALKKIAIYSDASYLNADTEEISHMLFGDGRKMSFFSTHPPLEDRIKKIDPGFQPEELGQLAAKIARDEIAAEKARGPQNGAREKISARHCSTWTTSSTRLAIPTGTGC